MLTFNQSLMGQSDQSNQSEHSMDLSEERGKRHRRRREGSQCVMGSANVMIHEVHQVHQVHEERGGVLKRQKILNGAQIVETQISTHKDTNRTETTRPTLESIDKPSEYPQSRMEIDSFRHVYV
ncbi:hypothetical protein BCON_0208g00230 [Botryotinia convoluta]|uniref:Uncharacterized protein n=1 Tax=Botryotinia convoluta TaxID=54673 RepID=A0A4Z1HS46_9HELO|nr:hypothetical protein BCON_0208g00230 [Botryotinia convoluta]